MADADRAQVYAAELAAFDGTDLEAIAPFHQLQALADRVMGNAWWPVARVPVQRARADARSSSTRQRTSLVVRLADPQLTPATLVHELAHVLAGVGAGHGATFRRAHVDVATVAFGPDAAAWLSEAYADAQLPLGTRGWPPPPDGALAL